jgi:hypothetical protein
MRSPGPAVIRAEFRSDLGTFWEGGTVDLVLAILGEDVVV